MKSKHLRTITTSLLLFQNCLYPLTVFAEEAPPELDTEFVQDLQNQGEQPVMQEPVSPETAANDSTEESIEVEEPVEENTEEIVEEAPVVEEVPIVEEQEVEEVPTEIPTEQPTEVTEPVTPWEDPVPPVLRQSAELRKNNLPNLDKYRPDLIANGKKSYIEKTLATQINRTIMLGAAVGSKTSFTVNVPTYEKVTQDKDHGWISWIASNLTTTDDYPYDTMYYGNHSSYRGTYTLTIPSDQSVNGYQVTVTKPSISSYAASFTVTITRLASTSAKEDRLVLNGDVKLGTTAVASQYSVLDSIPIEDVSYVNALLGTITVKKEQPEFEIKNEVTVEAQRGKELSTSILKSWFSTISENSGNYDYSLSSGPAEWAPGATGKATVIVKNKTTNNTQEFTTNYTVVDTTAPKYTVIRDAPLEARRKGSLTDEELRSIFEKLEDNWSKPEDLQIELFDYNGSNVPWEIAGTQPGVEIVKVRVTDQAGNAATGSGYRIQVVDTTPPDGKLKDKIVIEQGMELKDLRGLLEGDPTDNWSLPEKISLSLAVDGGKQVSELPRGEHKFTLTLTDEAGNPKELKGTLHVGDAFKIKSEVVVQAQRAKELSTEILKSWFEQLPNNPDSYDYRLVSGPAEWAPETNGQATVAVTNKATNETKEYETKYSVVDTKAPTATLKKEIVFEARRTGALTQAELRELLIESDLQDNWSLPEKITIGLTNIGSANEPFELVGKAPSMYSNIFITLTDEAGNTSRYLKNISVVDTQAPEGKLKESLFFEKGSKEPDLRELLDGEPTDNWSLPENIKLALSFKDGKQFSELPEGAHEFTLTLTDERGNARELKGKLYIGERFEIKSEVVVEAQRSQEISRTILESWFDKRPKDTDDYEYRLTNGPKEWAPGATGEVTVAVKNKTTNHTQELTTKYTVVDTKAPTAEFERSVSFEARRTGSLSREELMSVIKEGTLQDNWSLPEKITIGLEDLQGGKFEVAGKVPSSTAYVVASVLTDEAGNQQHFSPINLLIEDTTPPEGKLRDSLVYEQGSEMPDLRELLDGDPTDNWSLPENIRLELTFENGLEFSELPADDHRFTLKLIDEFGNKTELDGILTITSNAQYIDVTIPARMSFVQEDILAGIASPNYEIKNNSNRPVSVYVDAMTSLEETERLTELTLGLQNTDHEQEVVLVSNGQNLSETVELVTLTSEQNAYEFSFFGTAGDNILSETLDAPIRPSYLMQLHFKTP
ncbi:hypothetical protein [Enterococcus hirae]|uniref:hypothetical protein n=1 Tax=Enterococcus hirae TaxID=1354 RepID=UPI00159C76EF|nr:hypothetical protein [Enterococcus hirae]MBA5270876.1 hypothetical protein [Enterococcus hirae]NVL98462.1 hypothetical protein [Enterococcus hirae]